MARILLVDDDEALRAAMRLALEEDGHRVQTAGSAGRAIRLFDAAPPDIVVSDVYLPGGGLSVLEHATAGETGVPVVMVTGAPSPELRRRVHDRGADLLVKPIDLSRFRRTVAARLAEAPGADDVEPS